MVYSTLDIHLPMEWWMVYGI